MAIPPRFRLADIARPELPSRDLSRHQKMGALGRLARQRSSARASDAASFKPVTARPQVIQLGEFGPPAPNTYPQMEPLGITGRHGGWFYSRRLSGYPELEWSYPVMTERTWMLSSRAPALFYEPLSDFDQVRRAVYFSAELRGRGQNGPHVGLGFKYFPSFYRTTTGRFPMPSPGQPPAGQHFVAIVGSSGPDELIFGNSWGPRWGDSGYGYMTREYFDSHVSTAMVNWSSLTGPSDEMNGCIAARRAARSVRAEDWIECWPTPNEFYGDQLLIDGVRYSAISWVVQSLESPSYVYVFELRNPRRVVGRLHLYLPADDSGLPCIRELFIAPEVRRRGLGSVLEATAAEQAAELDFQEIEIWIGIPDYRPRCRPASRGFAERQGYAFRATGDNNPLGIATTGRRSIG